MDTDKQRVMIELFTTFFENRSDTQAEYVVLDILSSLLAPSKQGRTQGNTKIVLSHCLSTRVAARSLAVLIPLIAKHDPDLFVARLSDEVLAGSEYAVSVAQVCQNVPISRPRAFFPAACCLVVVSNTCVPLLRACVSCLLSPSVADSILAPLSTTISRVSFESVVLGIVTACAPVLQPADVRAACLYVLKFARSQRLDLPRARALSLLASFLRALTLSRSDVRLVSTLVTDLSVVVGQVSERLGQPDAASLLINAAQCFTLLVNIAPGPVLPSLYPLFPLAFSLLRAREAPFYAGGSRLLVALATRLPLSASLSSAAAAYPQQYPSLEAHRDGAATLAQLLGTPAASLFGSGESLSVCAAVAVLCHFPPHTHNKALVNICALLEACPGDVSSPLQQAVSAYLSTPDRQAGQDVLTTSVARIAAQPLAPSTSRPVLALLTTLASAIQAQTAGVDVALHVVRAWALSVHRALPIPGLVPSISRIARLDSVSGDLARATLDALHYSGAASTEALGERAGFDPGMFQTERLGQGSLEAQAILSQPVPDLVPFSGSHRKLGKVSMVPESHSQPGGDR
ncbi:hypothetical protein KIPB_007082 [Kipferlia bialata]|uniref:Uncharacterized protein n=1 Tax=Kipferlia bialata TaxID=797122 RepID=A0A9K3GGH9_9EUKA|nr:hypothetical protein KIPB_004320 [Kipferlia bialata]GIQ85420.1 hypothetical protein KIPB_007082 [Kipferlia bialata]|eukprot:g4320.t1